MPCLADGAGLGSPGAKAARLRRTRSPGQVRKYVYRQIYICTARYKFVPGGCMVSTSTRLGHTRFAVWVFAIRSLRRTHSPGQVRKYVYSQIHICTARYNFVPGGSMVSIQTRVGHTRFAVWVFAIRSLRRDRSAGQVRKYVYHEIEVRTRGF